MIDMNNPKDVGVYDEAKAWLLSNYSGNSWCAAVRNKKGVLSFVPRSSRPCYGEMRRYGVSSTRPDDIKPGDLDQPIPAGTRELIGLRLGLLGEPEHVARLVSFLYSTTGPYRRGVNESLETLTGTKGGPVAILMTDTEVDPTILVASFMASRNLRGRTNIARQFCSLVDDYGLTEAEALFACIHWNVTWQDGETMVWFAPADYFLNFQSDPLLFSSGDSHDLSNGRTFREEEDYNRPYLAETFKTEGYKHPPLPVEFRKHGYQKQSLQLVADYVAEVFRSRIGQKAAA